MKLYLIPAYEETIENQGYDRIISVAERKGYEVVVLNLQIKNRLLSDVVKEAGAIFKKEPDCTVFGFSTAAGVPALHYLDVLGLYQSDTVLFTYSDWIVEVTADDAAYFKTDFEAILASIKINI